MSTVLLMTDSWQPTVLRLVPFSNNNARSEHSSKNGVKHKTNNRGFPVLAVTRSSGNRSATPRSATSARYDYTDGDDASIIAESVVTNVTGRTDGSSSKQKYAKKKIPDMHSEMKEAIRFSVQDLNDQVTTTSTLPAGEAKTEPKEIKNNKLDNTRTKLPRPSLVPTPDVKIYSPINGVRRSVPLTPGELELQKYRDNYIVEQAQRKKRYKLNVNQIPRSTTPINDHDPDKLNMKQVIAFLQTKTSKDVQKKIVEEKRRDSGSWVNRKSQSTYVRVDNSFSKKDTVTEVDLRSKSVENNIEKPDSFRNDVQGRVSSLSTKSSPNLPYRDGRQSVKSNKSLALSTASVKSYSEQYSKKRSSKQKHLKEFRLYRFLAIAPDGPNTGQDSDSSGNPNVHPIDGKLLKDDKSDAKVSQGLVPRKYPHRRSRETSTANVIHRRVVNNKTNTSASAVAPPKDGEEQPKSIRLPSMTDADCDSAAEDSDTCSTTSATCNSIITKPEVSKYPKKGKTISFSDEIPDFSHVEMKLFDNNNNSVPNGYTGFPIRTFKSHDFPKVDISGPRHIHVNMPQENNMGYSQEIVRLTLRQDKNTTRVTSYMSDMQQNAAFKWHEVESSNKDGDGYQDNRFHGYPNGADIKDSLASGRQMVSTVASNNFIKVRQKLKSSNLCNAE